MTGNEQPSLHVSEEDVLLSSGHYYEQTFCVSSMSRIRSGILGNKERNSKQRRFSAYNLGKESQDIKS